MAEQTCGCGCSGCCGPKEIVIDFLYLDLSVCERCQGTEKNLCAAVEEASPVLREAGFEIIVNKVNITSKELAVRYAFESSPTIRVNGADMMDSVKETACCTCGDLCGDNVDCRVFSYNGEEHTEPPKAMILNAIFKAAYGGTPESTRRDYQLPKNLEVFFDGLKAKEEGS